MPSRRGFLAGLAATAMLAGCNSSGTPTPTSSRTPDPRLVLERADPDAVEGSGPVAVFPRSMADWFTRAVDLATRGDGPHLAGTHAGPPNATYPPDIASLGPVAVAGTDVTLALDVREALPHELTYTSSGVPPDDVPPDAPVVRVSEAPVVARSDLQAIVRSTRTQLRGFAPASRVLETNLHAGSDGYGGDFVAFVADGESHYRIERSYPTVTPYSGYAYTVRFDATDQPPSASVMTRDLSAETRTVLRQELDGQYDGPLPEATVSFALGTPYLLTEGRLYEVTLTTDSA